MNGPIIAGIVLVIVGAAATDADRRRHQPVGVFALTLWISGIALVVYGLTL